MSSRVKILVADDEPNILALVCGILQEEEYDVISATNGEEAIQKAFREKPDLMVVDVRMPHKNGFEVVEAIRANPDTQKALIIILSALEDESNKITGFEKGTDDYLTKPFSTEELKARIQALLKRARNFKLGKATETRPEITTEKVRSGIPVLDALLPEGLMRGANLLLTGKLGSGKSTFARNFLLNGLKQNEPSIFISLDEDVARLRAQLEQVLPTPLTEYEKLSYVRFVDAYSWASGNPQAKARERLSVKGALNLPDLTELIHQAKSELGQTQIGQTGGRMVLDSLSSLLINFELSQVQTFLTRLVRSSANRGAITSFYTLEEGLADEQAMNQVKFLMDGILEFGEVDGEHAFRVQRLKWHSCHHDWVPLSDTVAVK